MDGERITPHVHGDRPAAKDSRLSTISLTAALFLVFGGCLLWVFVYRTADRGARFDFREVPGGCKIDRIGYVQARHSDEGTKLSVGCDAWYRYHYTVADGETFSSNDFEYLGYSEDCRVGAQKKMPYFSEAAVTRCWQSIVSPVPAYFSCDCQETDASQCPERDTCLKVFNPSGFVPSSEPQFVEWTVIGLLSAGGCIGLCGFLHACWRKRATSRVSLHSGTVSLTSV